MFGSRHSTALDRASYLAHSLRKQVAAKTALTAKNLEALGPERLAGLLIEITKDGVRWRRK